MAKISVSRDDEIVLDSDALIAIDRGDRRVGAGLAVAARAGVDSVTAPARVAEIWREPEPMRDPDDLLRLVTAPGTPARVERI